MTHLHDLQEALTLPAAQLEPRHVQAARLARLGGALRPRLPQGHPARAALTADAGALAVRHARTRQALRPLLHAWAQAGIPTLLFKGFALSEFEYGTTSERFYGDVDVLLPTDPATVRRAVQIARTLGWQSDRLEDARRLPDWLHESTHLFAPHHSLRLDVHRWIIPALYVAQARAAHLTTGLWQRARHTDWDGLGILRPDPRDEVLLTLVANRVWGGDHGGLKGADYLDLTHLLGKVTPAALREHARQLGLTHTWDAFRQVCDPQRGHLTLQPDETSAALVAGMKADGVQVRRSAGERLRRVAFLLPGMPSALLDVAWAARAVRRGGDPRRHLARCPGPPTPSPVTPDVLDRTLTVTKHVTRLTHPRQQREGICVPRAYASYRALRRAGHPVQFLSGVTRAGGALLSHAWVEDHLGAMDAYHEAQNRQVFQVLLAYPPSGPAAQPPVGPEQPD
ncbi:lasso peptide biosynthesis B2 protein [Deinococcus actinosclerus]|uniref:Microcin J25-processing protein McjB C-terminal domain-containing protein n=1 Tax=Deinococcus actinosclerus TaxID=1768108 RepID=A0ABM5X3D9_9DEIO|nr:lasso peptide biosynthesis B2 protein [Deinococcus actinosclerus]ALW88240.1 hypothetical protein AUC44_04475 [Deinococcus actinosclerus]